MHWLARYRLLVIAGICLFWTGLVLLLHFTPNVPFFSGVWSGEQRFEDFLQSQGRKTPTRDDFVFLGIDQSTLELPPFSPEELANNRAFQLMTARPFPWSREVYALLLNRLFGAGARLVVFDLVFNPPNDGDPQFHAALDRYRDKVVVAANFDVANELQLIVPNKTLIPPPQLEDRRVGYVNFFPDLSHRKTRSIYYTLTDSQLAGLPPQAGEPTYYSLFGPRSAADRPSADVPLRGPSARMLRFSDDTAYPPHPFYEVFDPKFWHANYHDGAFFKGKIVMVGGSAQILHDVVTTPPSPVSRVPPAPERNGGGHGAPISLMTPAGVDFALVIGAGALAWALIAFVRRPGLVLTLLVGTTLLYLAIVRISYDWKGLLLVTVPVLTVFLLSGLVSLGYEYAMERLEKLRTRRTLERYARKLVKEILDNPGGFYSSLKGVRMPATVLFSDIVGFTSLTEHADPEALVSQLNEYLSRMTAAVFEMAHADKFIGDAVMADGEMCAAVDRRKMRGWQRGRRWPCDAICGR